MKKYIKTALLTAMVLLCGSCGEQPQEGVKLTTTTTAEKPIAIPTEPETTTVTTTQITTTEIPEEERRAVIAFAGDVTQSDVFGEATLYNSTSYALGEVAEIFGTADYAFLNLETCVSDRGETEKPEGFGFQSKPEYLEVFTAAGIDIVSLANNHVRDYGMDALYDTFSNVKEYGLSYVGAGKDITEANKLEVVELNGIKVGFTAFNMINMNPTWYATDERAGLACVDSENMSEYLELVKEYDKECDVLFVSVHWGIEYLYGVTEEQTEFAHALCDNGADIILGHHPHVLEPIEHYNGKVIFYSLGNFLFYKMTDDAGYTAAFTVEIDKNGFVSGNMYPVNIQYCKSNLLSEGSDLYKHIIGLQADMSDDYGITIDENGGIRISDT